MPLLFYKKVKTQTKNVKKYGGNKFTMYCACIKGKKLFIILATTILGILSFALLYITPAHTVFYGGTMRKLPIYRVQTDEKKVAISFDCAWGTDYTDTLLSIMEKEGVKCTFFMVEFWAEKHPEYVKKIFEAGHETGTHSATHPHMAKLTPPAVKKELTESCGVIEKITGKKVDLFRPPFGEYNDLVIDTARQLGLYTIQWDVDSLDWKDISAKEIQTRVLSRVKNGSIILFHNQGLHTAEALPAIIRELKVSGYKIVPIGELIYRENYRMLTDGAQAAN